MSKWLCSSLGLQLAHRSSGSQTSAFKSGDPNAYKAAGYDLWKSVRNAKMDLIVEVESSCYSSVPQEACGMDNVASLNKERGT